MIARSQAEALADAMNLHGVPLRTARCLDPATVKRVGSSASRQMRGRGDGGPYGLGARGGGALLGLGDAPIVAKFLAVGLGGRKRRLGARRDRIALVLGDSGEDVDRAQLGLGNERAIFEDRAVRRRPRGSFLRKPR